MLMSLEVGEEIEEERRSARGLMSIKMSRGLNKRNSESSESQVMAFSNTLSDAFYVRLRPTDSREITFHGLSAGMK